MKKKPRRKQDAGLGVIVYVGALLSLMQLYVFFDPPSLLITSLKNPQSAWQILRLPIFFLLLWLTCFLLVESHKKKKYELPFFENFSAIKGVAVLIACASIPFWKQLITDYHQATDVLHPFSHLIIVQVLVLLLSIIFIPLFMLPMAFKYLRGRKLKKSEALFLQKIRHNYVPNILWGKFFFKEVCTDKLGTIIGCFSGISYLIFFCMMLISLALPQSFAVFTIGNIVDAYEVNYAVWSKYRGVRKGSYCVLQIRTKDSVLEFKLTSCPICQPGAKAIVRHHPIDYQNRGFNSVTCINL